jgi:signal transduction histidine kinase
VPEALVLVDARAHIIAIDPDFCRAMLLERAQLLGAPMQRWLGLRAFEDRVQPALQRCFAGMVVTRQLVLAHPKLGQRQFSVTYHPCAVDDAAQYCAMILRDVTIEKLANDGYLLYAQWRDALNAIDRASLSEQPLPPVAAKALERLHSLAPYQQAVVAVTDELADMLGGVTGQRTPAGLFVVAALPPGQAILPPDTSAAAASLPLMVHDLQVGELAVWPPDGDTFSVGQIEMFKELAGRLERALQENRLRAQISRYTVDLEHTIAERTHEIERREERERLASELHDAVTQSIYSLTLFAEAGRRLAAVGQLDRVQEYLTLLGDTAQQAMKQMRLMLYELRPAVLEQVGLAQALRQRLDAVERRAGIEAQLEISEPLRLSPAVEESLYRICQETLNNALKHGAARTVVVRLRHVGNEVLLEVSDDGVGFTSGQEDGTAGLGLANIRERAARLNAELQIETGPDQGTTVRVSLLEREGADGAVWPVSDGSLPMDWTARRTPEEGDH